MSTLKIANLYNFVLYLMTTYC